MSFMDPRGGLKIKPLVCHPGHYGWDKFIIEVNEQGKYGRRLHCDHVTEMSLNVSPR